MNNAETDCAYNIHKKIYPASTTKILTALVALENGNLSDTVTVLMKLILVNLQQMNRHVASKQEISSHWKIC